MSVVRFQTKFGIDEVSTLFDKEKSRAVVGDVQNADYPDVSRGQLAPIIMQQYQHTVSPMRWGLVNDLFMKSEGYNTGVTVKQIRLENASHLFWDTEMQSFRCIVPMRSFRVKQSGVKGTLRTKDNNLLFVAGICRTRFDLPTQEYGFAIFVKEAPVQMGIPGCFIPVVLPDDEASFWLDKSTDRKDAMDILDGHILPNYVG